MESDAWKEGHDAFNDGIPLRDNPYGEDQVQEHNDWVDGWGMAADAFEAEREDEDDD